MWWLCLDPAQFPPTIGIGIDFVQYSVSIPSVLVVSIVLVSYRPWLVIHGKLWANRGDVWVARWISTGWSQLACELYCSSILQRVYNVLHCFIVNYNLANEYKGRLCSYVFARFPTGVWTAKSVAHLVLTGMYLCFAFFILGEDTYWKLLATLTFFFRLKLNLLLLASSSKMLSLVLHSVISL